MFTKTIRSETAKKYDLILGGKSELSTENELLLHKNYFKAHFDLIHLSLGLISKQLNFMSK